MKRFNKMTEVQMTKTNGGNPVVTFPTIVAGLLTVGATSAIGGAIGGAVSRANNNGVK